MTALWTAVGLTMLHYLWIGGAVGLAAIAIRRLLARCGASVRYVAAVLLLAVLAALPAGIFAGVWPSVAERGELASTDSETPATLIVDNDAARSALPAKIDASESTTSSKFRTSTPHEAVGDGAAADEPSPIESVEPVETATRTVDSRAAKPADTTTSASAQAVNDKLDSVRRAPESDAPPSNTSALPRALPHFAGALEFLVRCLPWLWLTGTPLTFLFLSVGLAGASRLRRGSRPVDDKLHDICRRLARSLRVTRQVTVAVCDRVLSPVLVGVLRPVILLPPAALVGWTPEQVEMVLLHELAHVRRHDNLVNLCQRIVESLFFYQPAVWLVSDWVRREREHCCDELVVARTGRPHDYAELLARLASAHAGEARLLGGLSSPMARSHLVARVRYLLHREYEPMQVSAKVWSLLAVVLVAALGVIAWQTSAPAESPLAGAPAAKELSPVHPVTKQPVLLETDGENEPKAQRGDQPATPVDDAESDVERRLFDALGVRVKQANASKLSNHFRGGLEIIEVENRARAGELGLRAGDVLVGIHVWEVTSLDDARFIFGRPEIASGDRIKLFIQRGGKTMFLTAALAAQGSADERQESDKPRLRSSVAAPVTPKELLRYDGKTFAQWREEWRTELKPERREEAIAAFRVFAANGFGPEAAQVIIEVMRSYDIGVSDKHDRAENNLKSTAIHAFNRIDSEDALPALIAELRDGNRNGRLFSLSVIGNLGHRADGALPAVLSAAKSDDAAIRVAALETAAELARFTGAKGEAYLPTVVAAFDDDSPAVRAAALKIAVDRAPDTKELLPAVRKALTDSDPGLVVAAIDVLLPLRRGLGVGTARAIPSESFGVDEGGFGDFALDEGVGVREPGVYVPELLDALKHSQDRVWRSAAQAIELLRGSAKDAIPRLLDMSITGPQYEQERAAYVLHKLTSLPRGQELELIHAALLDDLMRRLKDENRQQRVTGLQLLNRYSSRLGSVVVDVIPLLRPFLTDEDEQVREQAQRLLDAFEVYKSRPFRGSSFDRP